MPHIPCLRSASLCLALVVCTLSYVTGQRALAATPATPAKLRLAQAPEKPQQVLTVQQQLVAAKRQPDAAKSIDVTLVGQIGGMPNLWADTHKNFPWYEGQASFFLVDSKVASQFATHARHHGGNHNCAFCQSLAAKNAHAVAVVNLVDDNGEIITTNARDLLDLKENQQVVVRGKAKLLGGSMLIVDADGIFVPKAAR